MYAGTRTGSGSASGSVDADSVRMLPDDSIPMSATEVRNMEMTPLSAAEMRNAELMQMPGFQFSSFAMMPISADQGMTPNQVINASGSSG